MQKLKVVAIIPARSGSKGVYNKNVRLIGEQPLIAYSILDALRTEQIQETYVSTNGIEIANISLQYGAEVPFLRPDEYAQDNSLDIDWVIHFLQWFKEHKDYYPEYLIHLRPTTPFRELDMIEKAIEKIKKDPEATSLVSVEENKSEVYKSFKLGITYLQHLFKQEYHLLPRQVFPKVFKANGYVDILKVSTLLEGEFHGERILGFVTPNVIEIDNEEDLEYANFKYKYSNL